MKKESKSKNLLKKEITLMNLLKELAEDEGIAIYDEDMKYTPSDLIDTIKTEYMNANSFFKMPCEYETESGEIKVFYDEDGETCARFFVKHGVWDKDAWNFIEGGVV